MTALSAPVHKFVRSSGDTPITLRVAPDAVCALVAPDAKSSATNSLQLASDDEGVLHFYEHTNGMTASSRLRVTCSSESGEASTTDVTLDVGDEISAATSEPDTFIPHGTILYPLTDDPAKYTPAQLATMGYPPRPDATAQPGFYAKWLRAVTTTTTRVSSKTVKMPGVRNGLMQGGPVNGTDATSQNWTGIVVTNPIGQYSLVGGEWTVPGIVQNPPCALDLGLEEASEWVGLDGASTSDNEIIQAGTISVAYQEPLSSCGRIVATGYNAWIEYYTDPMQIISNMAISPNDDMFAEVYACDTTGNANPHGVYGCYQVYDFTSGASYVKGFYAKPQKASPFSGSTAEFIIERPADQNNNLFPLFPYGSTQMGQLGYLDTGSNGSTNSDLTNAMSFCNMTMQGINIDSSIDPDVVNNYITYYWHNYE